MHVLTLTSHVCHDHTCSKPLPGIREWPRTCPSHGCVWEGRKPPTLDLVSHHGDGVIRPTLDTYLLRKGVGGKWGGRWDERVRLPHVCDSAG